MGGGRAGVKKDRSRYIGAEDVQEVLAGIRYCGFCCDVEKMARTRIV
jgi:hypothetical protein